FSNDIFGDSIARIRGNPITQTVNVGGSAGDGYVFGGFAIDSYQYYQAKLTLIFNYTDGSKGENEIFFDANDMNLGYLVNKAEALKDYSSITFKIEAKATYSYYSVKEYIYVDNLALYKEGYGIYLEYNEEG